MRKKRLRIFFIAFAVGAGVLFTGGLAFDCGITYETESVNVLCPVSSIEAYGWVGTTIEEIDIPWIFHSSRFTKPFHISLTITDLDSRFTAINISHGMIEYANGKTNEFDMEWERQFQTNSYARAMDEGLVYINKWQVDDKFNNVEIYPHDSKITLSGILTTSDGETFPLKITITVKVNRMWKIMTAWEKYASC